MVNRNDDTVTAVFVAGRAVFVNGASAKVLGTRRNGSFLRARPHAAAGAAESCSGTCRSTVTRARQMWSAMWCGTCGRRSRAATGRLSRRVCRRTVYVDMPVGAALAAQGPEDIVNNSRSGSSPWPVTRIMTACRCATALRQFDTVHYVRDGKITLGKDHWDMGSMTAQAPNTWLAHDLV